MSIPAGNSRHPRTRRALLTLLVLPAIAAVDPMQADGQMFDRGSSYMTVVYFRNEAQREAALASKKAIEASGVLKGPIATQIRSAGPFYRAEEYHQEYGRKNPVPYGAYRIG